MLQIWLGELTPGEFRERHYGRVPLARAGTARASVQACTWKGLERMLTRVDPERVLVVSRGRVVGERAPRSLAELTRLFAAGAGVVIRDAERASEPIAALAEAIGSELPGLRRVLVFATPAGTHGFGWHYDAEDVLILQTAGSKEYYFRANTIDPDPQYGAQPDFARIRDETSPLMSCRLVAGDWLYLPRAYWHIAQPSAHALSVSIGIRAQTLADSVNRGTTPTHHPSP
jgi:ribosomal protein L16 Arg81 hydroxylase